MSVSRLRSGRWRAQIYDSRNGGVNLAVPKVLGPPCPQSFATKEDAEHAREQARKVLRAWHEAHPRPLVVRPSMQWGLVAKGEDECRNCGAAAKHLHHIVPKALNPEGRQDIAENGLPLCTGCHGRWHSRVIEIAHDIFTDAEFLKACKAALTAWGATVEERRAWGYFTGDERIVTPWQEAGSDG